MTQSNKEIKDYDFSGKDYYYHSDKTFKQQKHDGMKCLSEKAITRDKLNYARLNLIFADSKFSYYYVNGQEVEPNFNIN